MDKTIGPTLFGMPGPTPIPDRVLGAMHRQPVEIYDPELIRITESCLSDLSDMMGSRGETFIYAATGHGAWEAALTNALAPGDEVLVLECGRFAGEWGEMARDLGHPVRVVPGCWRRAVEPAAVLAALEQDSDHRIAAVLVPQVDTASGIWNDIAAIGRAIEAAGHPALFMVDAIGSFGSMPFRMDAWGVDVAIAAAQKGLMCPPGLSFVTAGSRAMERHNALDRRGHYWDWTLRQNTLHYFRYCGTPPEHLLFALREALDMLAEEGAPAVHARHRALARATWAAVDTWTSVPDAALDYGVAEPAHRADTVTTLLTAPGFDPDALCRLARERFGAVIGPGIGALKGKSFRLAHMGHVNAATLLGLLSTAELAMQTLGWPVGAGGVEAAITSLRASGSADLVALEAVQGAVTGR